MFIIKLTFACFLSVPREKDMCVEEGCELFFLHSIHYYIHQNLDK